MRVACTTQNTAEWLTCRAGKITASRMADVLNRLKSGEEGAKRRKYRSELVAERLSGRTTEKWVSPYMDRGNEYESEARSAYEDVSGEIVGRTGFVLHPTMDFSGASPDGICTVGGVELKVPQTETHIEYMRAGIIPPEYRPQMVWNMVCCEMPWWDFCSYDPSLPAGLNVFVVRLERDEKEIAAMEFAVVEFNAEVERDISDVMKYAKPVKERLKADLAASVEAEQYITDSDVAWIKEQQGV